MDLYNASIGQEEPEEIELTIEQYEEAKSHFAGIISKMEAAKRLANNDDFKLLVMTGFLVEEPQRYAELIASGRLNEKVRDDCVRQLTSVGDFRNYMKNIIEQGNMAVDELQSLEEARDMAIEAETKAG